MVTLALINFVFFVIILCLLFFRPRVVEISDTDAVTGKAKDRWLKLQNEGAKYIKKKDGRIYLKIVK